MRCGPPPETIATHHQATHHHSVAESVLILHVLNQAPNVVCLGVMAVWASKLGVIKALVQVCKARMCVARIANSSLATRKPRIQRFAMAHVNAPMRQ